MVSAPSELKMPSSPTLQPLQKRSWTAWWLVFKDMLSYNTNQDLRYAVKALVVLLTRILVGRNTLISFYVFNAFWCLLIIIITTWSSSILLWSFLSLIKSFPSPFHIRSCLSPSQIWFQVSTLSPLLSFLPPLFSHFCRFRLRCILTSSSCVLSCPLDFRTSRQNVWAPSLL